MPDPTRATVTWFIDDLAAAIKPDDFQPPVSASSVLNARVVCLLELDDGTVLAAVGRDRFAAHRAATALLDKVRPMVSFTALPAFERTAAAIAAGFERGRQARESELVTHGAGAPLPECHLFRTGDAFDKACDATTPAGRGATIADLCQTAPRPALQPWQERLVREWIEANTKEQ